MAKIRKGFVSNSSSSSFIVAFPKDMDLTPEAVKAYLFKDAETLQCYGDSVPTSEAAEVICNTMKSQTPNDIATLTEACEGYLNGAPEYESFKNVNPIGKSINDAFNWDAYNTACNEYRDKFLKEFMSRIPENMNVYSFEFSDNDGNFYSTLEHGDTFCNTIHEQISRH